MSDTNPLREWQEANETDRESVYAQLLFLAKECLSQADAQAADGLEALADGLRTEGSVCMTAIALLRALSLSEDDS